MSIWAITRYLWMVGRRPSGAMDKTTLLAACKTGDFSSLRSAIELTSRTLSEMAADDIHLLRNQLPCTDIDGILEYLRPTYPNTIDRSMAMSAIDAGSIDIFSLLAAHDPSIITRNYGHFGNPISCAIHLPNALDFI